MMVCSLVAAIWPPRISAAEPQVLHWYKGNTHMHTINSDGNATPDAAVRWYRENGYQFVVITDHDYITSVAPLNALYERTPSVVYGSFLVLPGEEVTQRFTDQHQAHINAIDPDKLILPMTAAEGVQFAPVGVTVRESLKRNVKAVLEANGIPQVNHPNYRWSVRPDDLADLPSPFLLEIWNAGEHNLGGTDDDGNVALSSTALWDTLLSRGQVAWGVASDDSHDYTHLDNWYSSRPGRAWIVIRAETLTKDSVRRALISGEFYSSTGVRLRDVISSNSELCIAIERENDCRYSTEFVGKDGHILARVPGLRPTYRFDGDELYVRAEIKDSRGKQAWVQPVYPRRPKK